MLPLAVTGLVLASGLGVLAFRSAGREPLQVVLPPPAAETEVRVYVSGAVTAPGVYALGGDDRVEDALRAAGGPLPEADLERVNLALRVRDGDQVQVPTRPVAGTPASAPIAAPKVNLNTAPLAELDKLPGIGAVRAKRIVESRELEGPFAEPFELVERRLVTTAIYQRLRDLVAVR